MTSNERKLFYRTIALGVLITINVIILDGFGALDFLERNLYDYRARDCQFFTPAPTDRLVHLDIDDPTLTEIGSFPWPRSKLAEMVNEVHLAGAKLLGMDIIFAEPQETRWLAPGDNGKSTSVNDDQKFADSVRSANNVLLPLSLNLNRVKRSPVYVETLNLLLKDLELDGNEVIAKLRGSPIDSKNLAAQVHDEYVRAHEEAMFRRVDEMVGKGITDPAALHEKLTPTAYKRDLKTDASFLLDQTLANVQSVRNILQFTVPLPTDAPPLTIAENEQAITIPVLTGAIHYCGYVDFPKSADGVVRSIPLFVNYRGRLIPHMAMATACAILDIDLNKIQFTEHTVTLPLPTGERIIIPVRTISSSDFGNVGTFMDIPWFGTSEWKYSYDVPNHQDSKQHLPLNSVWRICELRRDLESLNDKTDDALKAIVQVYRSSLKDASKFIDEPAEQRTDIQRTAAIKDVIDQVGSLIDLSVYDKMKPSEYNEDEKLFVPAYRALIQASKSLEIDTDRIQKARTELRSQLNGRAAVIGFTATGNMDTYTTSIHAACPGVVIQGMVINGILTRDLWRAAPWWITVIITLFIGTLVTLSVASFPPKQAMVCTIGLVAAYFIVNGIILFDWGNLIVGIAAPLVTGFAVYIALTAVRYISERAQRNRITNRFRSYVDPMLVNYLVEHPDAERMDGQVKLMTVVFTDLAGFTTISEKLRERTVPLLNEYMSLMLPIIRENGGLWNKFLGDGIMFFFNAPLDNPHHARDAVRTVMQMQKALIGFNEHLLTRDLPNVGMRAGISTGSMIVGDAGSTDIKHGASDYTVLGDEVNLGARLESANKYLGSKTLLNQLAAELCGDEFLLRPMGNICVMGKSEGVHCFDAICPLSEASDAQRRLAELSTWIVKSFRESDFVQCVKWAEQLKKSFGPSKFADLYLSLAALYMSEPPGEKFDGQIVLSEK